MTGTGWDEDDGGQQWPQPPAAPAWQPTEPPPEPDAQQTGGGGRPRGKRRLIAAIASVAAIAVIAVVIVVVSSGSGQTPAQAVAAAVRKSANVNTLSADIKEQISGQSSALISGTVLAQRKPLLMSMKLSEHVSSGDIPVSAILTGSAMYLKIGVPLGLPASAAGKWIELPFARLGPASVFATLLHTFADENPMSQVQALIAMKGVRAVGTQVVNGVQATRYSGSFAPSTALKFLPASQRSLLAPALKLINGNVAVNIWISGGHIVKFTETEHVSTATVAVTVQYRSFNQPVRISIPPASQAWIPPASALSGTS